MAGRQDERTVMPPRAVARPAGALQETDRAAIGRDGPRRYARSLGEVDRERGGAARREPDLLHASAQIRRR